MSLTEKDTIQAAVSRLDFRTRAFVDGKFADAACGKSFVTENPAIGKPLAEIAACDQEDVNRAVKAARSAFEKGSWSRMHPNDRKNILSKFADLLETHSDELALLDCLEAGKPIQDCSTIDIPETVQCIRWHAETIDKLYNHVSTTGPDNLGLILREPIGVVGAVIPWNFPALMAAWKIGPTLAAGNSVLLKPAELTSLSALRMGELAAEAGVPQGVFNVLPGLGDTAGQAIGLHMDIDMVAFTGSTEVGRLFLSYAAQSNLKRIILECGGKSPQVVMADAPEIDRVAENALNGAFWNMGENCSCFSSEEQAISIANDTNYGLAASVYTQDVNAVHRISRALKAGTVSVNCFSEGDMTTPFGGFKESGFFGRDKSIWAHEQYTQLKTIWMQLD